MTRFKALGILVALYTIYAVTRGEVYAKSGVRGRIVSREDSPEYFWVVIVTFAGLSVALITVFRPEPQRHSFAQMVLILDPDALNGVSGVVRYRAAFDTAV